MKFKAYLITVAALLAGTSAAGQTSAESATTPKDTSTTDFRPRLSIEVEKELVKDKLSISLEEELRMKTNCRKFDRLNTSLSLTYSPSQYFKMAPEYTFIASQDQNKLGQNEWELRHRVALNLTGQIRVGQWKFSLRERPQVTIRTDEINKYEKMKATVVLRSRFEVEYSFFKVPLKLFAHVEMTNPLNTPKEFTGPYEKDGTENVTYKLKLKDYPIAKMRYAIGAQYRFDKRNYLELSYRLDDGVDYDINIANVKGYLKGIEKEKYLHHLLCISYKFSF